MRSPKVTIRASKPQDAEGVAAIHIKSWQETYRGFMPENYLDNLESLEGARRQEFWKKNLSSPEGQKTTWVADVGGKIVGFVSVGKSRDDGLLSDGEIFAIYLLKAHQGQGVGRSLFEAGMNVLKGMNMGDASLWVAKGNRTEGFYRHLGGIKCGEKIGKCGGADALAEVQYFWPSLKGNLEARKLVLGIRDIVPEDAHFINRYWSENTDEDLSRLGEVGRPDPQGNIEFIEQFCKERAALDKAEEGIQIWLVDDKAVGYSTLKEIRFGNDAQIHLHMWEKGLRGKGIGAVLFCLSALKFIREFQLNNLYCQPKFDNPMPNQMLQKIGFALERQVEWTNPGNGSIVKQNRYLIDESTVLNYLRSSDKFKDL